MATRLATSTARATTLIVPQSRRRPALSTTTRTIPPAKVASEATTARANHQLRATRNPATTTMATPVTMANAAATRRFRATRVWVPSAFDDMVLLGGER